MKSISIKGVSRQNLGKSAAKQLRNQEHVPCVLYGGKEPVHFSAPALEFKNLVYTPSAHTVELSIDGKGYNAILQDVQFHPVSDKISHIDFLELFADKPVVMDIPVKVKGSAVGVRKGGQLLTKMRKLKVRALPAKLPDFVEVNIDPLDISDSIRVGDISMDGVEFLDSPRNIITAVKTARQVVEEVTTAPVTTAAAPAAGVAPAAGAPAPAAGKKAESDKK